MSTTEPRVSRPVALLLGLLLGIVLVSLLWAFVLRPLLAPGDDLVVVPTPTPTAVEPLPPETLPPAGSDPVGGDELDALLELDQVEEEQFEIAGARDPFSQVVVEAQVAEPTAAPGTGTTPTTAPATGSGTTGSGPTATPTTAPTTGSGSGGGTGTDGGSGDDADEPGAVGDITEGGTELAATGLDSGPLALLALLLAVAGTGVVAGTGRRRRP